MIKKRERDDGNILILELIGKVGLDEIMACLENILKEKSSLQILRILEDATHVEFDFKMKDLNQINNLVSNYAGDFLKIKHVMIRDKPLTAAYGIWQERENSIPHYEIKVVSCFERALLWLIGD